MKHSKRRFINLCIYIVCLITISIPITVFSANIYSEGDFHYQLDGDYITITEYFGRDSEVTVPSMIAGYPVAKIAEGAFIGTSVKKLYLPDTIMTIESQAIDKDISVVYANKGMIPEENQKTTNEDHSTNEEHGTNGDHNTTGNQGNINESDVNISETLGANTTLSVDSQNRLVAIDQDNHITILDDSISYKVKEQEDGSIKIVDSKNREVVVDENGSVTIPAKQKNETKNTVKSKEKNNTENKLSVTIIVIAVVAIVIVSVIVVLYVLFCSKGKKNHQ